MNSVMTLDGLATRPEIASRVRVDQDARCFFLERENAYLTQNNAKLRLQMKDLEASSLYWIRLYEAALDRAKAATAECERLRSA
jgi:cell division protein FtsB